jgi:uncharacterized protein (TIGR03437 family)
VDANTVQVTIPLSVQATPLSLTVANPGTPQSNPMNLMEGRPVIAIAGIGGTVAPGQAIVVTGLNVGPMAPFLAPQEGAPVTTLGNTQVLFDGVPGQIVAAYFRQVRVIVPASVAGKTSTAITVKYFDQSSAPRTVGVNGNALPADPFGPGISGILNADGSVNSASKPAPAGALVMLVLDRSQLPGDAVPAAVTIGGADAAIVGMDEVIGQSGKLLFQVRVPGAVQAGPAPMEVRFRGSDSVVRLTIVLE